MTSAAAAVVADLAGEKEAVGAGLVGSEKEACGRSGLHAEEEVSGHWDDMAATRATARSTLDASTL